MTVTQLAEAADVAAVLGRSLTATESTKVEPVLDRLSQQFRRLSKQLFTPGSSTVRLRVHGGDVYLPQVPVVAVEAVIDDDANAVTYTRMDQWLSVTDPPEYAGLGGPLAFVRVTYTHGDAVVPDEVRLCIAEAAKRAILIPDAAASGATQHTETAGSLTESTSFAAWAVGGQSLLSPDDRAFAKSFRLRYPRLIVMQP
ncbi:MAG: hypothetical protein Q7V58_09480 [Actinomycetota bacterium]|nr:hypothetical protein [Actinomycetota bacterium]